MGVMAEHLSPPETPTAYPLDSSKQVFTPATRSRRQWLKGALGAAATVVVSYLAWTKYFFPAAPPAPPAGTPLGATSAFAVGTPQLVKETYVVERLSDTDFRVLSAKCTHQGCAVNWEAAQGKLVCPCHAGQFDRTGKNVGGPPPSPLPTLRSHVQGSTLYVEG